jgi:succinyl-CoA synthetase beta subunit
MNLHEYQAKQLFSQYGLPVPVGYACASQQEAEDAATNIGDAPWVVKCQVHAGGRGKAGGVKLVNNKQDIRTFVDKWLGKRLVTYQTNADGQPVNKILVESVIGISKELYLGAIVDRSTQRIVIMASTAGGMDIETVAQTTPEQIYNVTLDPLTGPQVYQGRELAYKLGLEGKQVAQFSKIFMGLARLFLDYDLTLVEINPLAITESGDLLCLDAKISADNNALYRQPELKEMRDVSQEEPLEAHAAQSGLSYVALDGNIGCLVNGAGLAMGTMDIVKLYGGSPANFLDVGGSATKERVAEAFKIILSDNKVKAVFVNIFGGIVRCDLIADGIIGAIAEVGIHIPVVVRLEGNNADIGAAKLAESGLNVISATSLTDAAKRVVAAVETA